MTNLMDDLAYDIHKHLMDVSTDFKGQHLVMLPITKVVEKFKKRGEYLKEKANG